VLHELVVLLLQDLIRRSDCSPLPLRPAADHLVTDLLHPVETEDLEVASHPQLLHRVPLQVVAVLALLGSVILPEQEVQRHLLTQPHLLQVQLLVHTQSKLRQQFFVALCRKEVIQEWQNRLTLCQTSEFNLLLTRTNRLFHQDLPFLCFLQVCQDLLIVV